MGTIIGIDPHKSSLTAVDDQGTLLGTRRLTVNKGTGTALLKWASAFEDPFFAVEGAKGLGRSISQILVARNQAVVDVPATLSMKIRVLTTGGGHKTDPQDALKYERTGLLHRLRQLFRELLDGGVPTGLTLARARAAMKRSGPAPRPMPAAARSPGTSSR
jgi:transposase